MEQHRREALLKEYGEVSSNFRLLTDIRFKLLAFLPIATAAAAALKDDAVGVPGLVLSLFGLAATIGLAIYNTRNDQLYDALVGRATEIERTLGLPDGAFANRPRPWLTVNMLGVKGKIDHRTGVGTIYAASIALWLFGVYFPGIELLRRTYSNAIGATSVGDPSVAAWTYLVAFAVALLSTYLALESIRSQRKARQERMRELAASAVQRLGSIELNVAAKDAKFVGACAELAGIDADTVQARARFYGSLDAQALIHYMPTEPKVAAMSHFVALLTDLPPRWILDCATNRREAAKPITVSKDAV